MYFGRVETDKIAKNKVGPMPWDTLYIFMVMRNKIVWDQLPHRAARLKVLPFASFTPIAVVGTARRVSDITQYAHFPGTQLQCLGVQQTGLVTTAMQRWVVMLHTSSDSSQTSPGVDIESISISMRSKFLSAGAV